MKHHVVQQNFTSGRVAPTMYERYDYQQYNSACRTLDNFIILPQGGVTRRPGTRFVKAAKDNTATRLIPFVVSTTIAYVLEMGSFYMRFFTTNGQLIVGGVPLELLTPYTAAELNALHWATNGQRMVFAHPNHPPYELIRQSALSWRFQQIRFIPPPSYEAGVKPLTTLHLSATSGLGQTATLGNGYAYPTDVQRRIMEIPEQGNGQATVTKFIDSTHLTIDITAPFATVDYPSGGWVFADSPAATLHIDSPLLNVGINPPQQKTQGQNPGPVGTKLLLTGQLPQTVQIDLFGGETFTNLNAWTNKSGPVVCTGTAAAGSNDTNIIDGAQTFLSKGARPGHRAQNTTTADEDRVTAVDGEFHVETSTNGATFAAGNAYTIRQTGVAYVSGNKAILDGGAQGVAWIEQSVTVVVGLTYQIEFSNENASLSVYAGTASGLSDLLTEFSYTPDNNHLVTFTATTATAVIAFRNNQNQVAQLYNISCRQLDIPTFRAEDAVKWIRVNNGLVEVTEVLNSYQVHGIIRKELDDALDALAGAWSLEISQWSDTDGWPHTLAFQGGRLVFSNTAKYPMRLWGSRLAVLYDFSSGTADSDSYQFDVAATNVNPVNWLAGERGLLAGAERAEYVVLGGVGFTITPTGIDVSSPTSYGSVAIQPARPPRALLFVHRSGRKIYENAGINDFTGNNREVNDRTILVEDLMAPGVAHISYQQLPRPVLWTVMQDGSMNALIYLREEVVGGWTTQGTQGSYIDVASIPHPDGNRDQTWVMVRRVDKAPYIEFFDDSSGFYGQAMTDASLSQNFGVPTLQVTGLNHLSGLTVQVLGDGNRQNDKVVVNGQVTLDTPAQLVEVGLGFQSTLATLRPTHWSMPLSGLPLSSCRTTVNFINTNNAIINAGDVVERINFQVLPVTLDAPVPLYTGPKEVNQTGWDFDAVITLKQDQPYPMTVTSISRIMEITTSETEQGSVPSPAYLPR